MKHVLPLLLFPILLSAQPATKQVQEFDAYVQRAMRNWEVPGLAVVVVKNGQVAFQKAYGLRELGATHVVDTETLFACASTTKAMTAACMGMLVDEGKVKWADRVSDYLPGFQLYDPYVTRELRIRDLFIHNSGVGNADFLWDIMNVSSDEVLRRMRYVEPSYSFRSGFIYQNIFYLAAGKVIEKVSGMPWHAFIHRRLFEPLEMNRTKALYSQVTRQGNYSSPHHRVDGRIQKISYQLPDSIGPAGSVWSSIGDLTHWMQCMLDSGRYKEKRLLTPATWLEILKPHTLVTDSEFYPTQQLTRPAWKTYGYGWFQHDYKGRKLNFHTGSLGGLVAIHGQIPEENIAVYVLGNLDHAELRHALMYKALDHFALGGTRDWHAEVLKLYRDRSAQADTRKKEWEAKRVTDSKPRLTLPAYEGKYTSELYGEARVTLSGDSIRIAINHHLFATLGHWEYDTFYGYLDEKWMGNLTASFTIGTGGKVTELDISGAKFTRAD
jgi:CubicO group peptidase (beta-lactamase class C family)